MAVAKNLDAKTQGETQSWAWPLYVFVAWLAGILGYVTRFKRIRRTHKFKADWRDSWEDLRQSEWLREQLIAQGLAQLLANQPLQLDDTKINLEPPATYGGPCPSTPFEMNRRFLALARWVADAEAVIRQRFRRLARHEGNNPLAAHGSTDALRAAHHEAVGVAAFKNAAGRVALMVSSDRRERPSNHEGVLTKARGPPTFHFAISRSLGLSAHASEIAPACLEQPAPQRTSGGPMCHRSAASRRNETSCGRGPVS